jgi:TonB family protein
MFGAAQPAPPTRSGPRPLPFLASLIVHSCILGLVVFGPPPHPWERQRSLYDQVIRPHEHKLVWYSFRQKLPEVTPPENRNSPPPAAEFTNPDQTIVSNPKLGERGAQMIWRPVPQIKPQPQVASPNILAFRLPLIAPPPPGPLRKLFAPPEPQLPKPAEAAPALLEPPKIQAKGWKQNSAIAANLAAALENRPKPRNFVPPVPKPERRAAAPGLPEAPGIRTTLSSARVPMLAENLAAPLANKPQPRKFVPPPAPVRAAALPAPLPDAPKIASQLANANGAARNPAIQDVSMKALANKPKPRAFVPPPPAGAAGALSAPAVPPIVEAPALDVAGMPSANVNVAVVGLNPATKLSGPLPDTSRDAKFSAGPNTNGAAGGAGAASGPALSVPGLLVRNGVPQGLANSLLIARATPTSRETLEAAAKAAHAESPDPPSAELHLVPPPDPEFNGRDVYSLAVQMPNISSYVGSWIMWFAEREPGGPRRELRPPVPVHKVDPKYFPEAIAERVEGKVVLVGILQTDGRVREIRILKGVDPRLDLSAARALRKWEFEPAQRNGMPVEVDMVTEIPFLLPPEVRR